MNKVVVVIPVYRGEINEYEKISFAQNITILRDYSITIVTHRWVDLSVFTEIATSLNKPISIEFFDAADFDGIKAYNNLLISPRFYRRFDAYDYMLVCQLDCFIFEDSLNAWIEKGYSYIGAPWVKDYVQDDRNARITGMGNGGLSLRKVSHFLKVLNSFSYIRKPVQAKRIILRGDDTRLKKVFRILCSLTISNNTYHAFNDWSLNEDRFWAEVPCRNFHWFKVPDWKEALGFSIEIQPDRFVEMNNGRLPFGCHAWWTYDLEFWKPYLESYGHVIEITT